jgi:HPt (histidine-containing phosphotransfer) domain-containing protein
MSVGLFELAAPVDIDILLSLAEAQDADEPDLVVELIDLYLADTPRHIVAMHEALASNDQRMLARAAHALKGSSSTLGAVQVAQSCEDLERLAPALPVSEVAGFVERLEEELATVRDVFLVERQKRSA